MRILITNNALNHRAGSELYVRDVALALLKCGHTPIAYSTVLGDVAREIRAATIPVVDNLDALSVPPDVIHGQHHLDTMTALLRFPGVPAVYFCHGWLPWEEAPPRFPRILRYVAIDNLCRDRLLLEHALPEERIRLLLNFVDLERFKTRGPLPARPQRALVFNNYANESYMSPLREACAHHGIQLDVVGMKAGNACARPEEILGSYDLVFAKGRAALEALAVGAAVITCGVTRVGPMVTSGKLDDLRLLNFGLRALSEPISAEAIEQQIARYNPRDAASVSRLVRASAGREDAVDQIISWYREVIAENASKGKLNGAEESEAASSYLRWLSPTYKAAQQLTVQLSESFQLSASTLAEKESQLKAAQENASQLAETVQEGLSSLAEKESQLKAAQESSSQLADRVREGLSTLAEKESQLKAAQESSSQLADRVREGLSTLAEKESQLKSAQECSSQLADQLKSAQECSSQLAETVQDGLSKLAEKESQVEKITSSFGWRLINRYGPIKHRFLLPAYRNISRLFKSNSRS